MNIELKVRKQGLQAAIDVCNGAYQPDHTSYVLGTITYHGKTLGGEDKFSVPGQGRKRLKLFSEIAPAIAEVITRAENEFDPLRDKVHELWSRVQAEAIKAEQSKVSGARAIPKT